jgi:hypothetical protein
MVVTGRGCLVAGLAAALLPLACGKARLVADAGEPASVLLPQPPSEPVAPPPSEPVGATSPAPAADAGISFTFGEDDAAAPSPLTTTCAGVSLVIASVRTSEDSVDAVVELRNGSGAYVPLMLTGDGSVSGGRNPTLSFELSPSHIKPAGRCGNMNPLSASEIIFLRPHERRQLDWLHAPRPSLPGRYSLRATYHNDPTSTVLGDNPPGPATQALIARVRKTVPCTLVSNTVAFTWTEPPDAGCRCQMGDPLCTCR